jgi:hypothetical protein
MTRLILRTVAVWLIIIALETVHGILRSACLAPLVGDFTARQIAVFSGSILILLIASLTVHWIRAETSQQLLLVGLIWVALTLLFEISLGRLILGLPWDRILEDYDLSRGGLLGLGLLFLLLAPLWASRLRSK